MYKLPTYVNKRLHSGPKSGKKSFKLAYLGIKKPKLIMGNEDIKLRFLLNHILHFPCFVLDFGALSKPTNILHSCHFDQETI